MAFNLALEDDWPEEPLVDLSWYDLEGKPNILLRSVFVNAWSLMAGKIDIVKLEDRDLLSIPSADEVMDTTEQDNLSVHEESDQQANINHEDLDGTNTKPNGDDEGGLFGSGSEDDEDAL